MGKLADIRQVGKICINRSRYGDVNDARRRAKNASRKHESKEVAYRCLHCNGWHIGATDDSDRMQVHKNRKRNIFEADVREQLAEGFK